MTDSTVEPLPGQEISRLSDYHEVRLARVYKDVDTFVRHECVGKSGSGVVAKVVLSLAKLLSFKSFDIPTRNSKSTRMPETKDPKNDVAPVVDDDEPDDW